VTERYPVEHDNCRTCGKPLRAEGHRRSETGYCGKDCHAWANRLRRVYSMTPEEYHARLIAQSGRCDICDDPLSRDYRRMSIDHSHHSGRVRGLLCQRCNSLLGYLEKPPRRVIYAALDYIRDNTFTHEAVVGAIH
jgi:hypothetical protein